MYKKKKLIKIGDSNFSKDFITIFLLIIIYFLPIIFYGNNFEENYQSNHFTLKLYLNNFFSPFLFYYDLIGPGTTLPLDTGLTYLFPPSFLIFNMKLFYFSTLLVCFYIQLNYLKKIFKLLQLKHLYILIFLYSINVGSVFTILVADQLKTFFYISFIPLIFYYFFKFNLKRNNKDFFKLSLFASYLFLNVHPSSFIILFMALLLMFLFNKLFFLLKERYFYICLIFFISITSEEIYRIVVQYKLFEDVERMLAVELNIKHFFSGFVFFLKFVEDYLKINISFVSQFEPYDTFFLPFAGIVYYFAFFYSIFLIVTKQSAKVFFLNILFLSYSLISLFDPRMFFFSIVSASNLLFDIVNFCSIILFAHFLKKFKDINANRILIFPLIFISIFYFQNIDYKQKNKISFNNINLNKNYKNSEFFQYFKNFKNDDYSKVYLSPIIWNSFDNAKEYSFFLEGNVFNPVDLTNYNLFPFNSIFKLSSKKPLRVPKDKFYTEIEARYDDINNLFFLNIFNINYLFLTEKEKNLVNLENFKFVKGFKSDNKIINFYQLKKREKLIIKDLNNNKIQKCIDKELVYCLIKNINIDVNKYIKVNKKGLNKYEIRNESNESLNFLLPFLYDKSWKSDNAKILNIKESLMYISLPPQKKVEIYYSDMVRNALKLISLITFFSFIFYIVRKNA